jgi:hypothetical protein
MSEWDDCGMVRPPAERGISLDLEMLTVTCRVERQ